jgi:uroporphyrinogen-III decarboxylase
MTPPYDEAVSCLNAANRNIEAAQQGELDPVLALASARRFIARAREVLEREA